MISKPNLTDTEADIGSLWKLETLDMAILGPFAFVEKALDG